LFEAFPALRETMFESYCNRTERSGEPCSFELPGLFGSDTWHRMETFRTHQGVVMLARDITDDVKAYRLADTKKALIEAILAHGGIGYIWFNVRGRIEEVDAAMSDLLQLPRERLSNVSVVDLVPVGQRVMLREAIETVLSHGGTQRFETEFLRNDGTTVPAVGAIKDLRGVYGSEGAVMVVTRK
jgi:PAS domain S-box-containing protein